MIEAIGRYRVVRPLGRGGMGQVYLAEDPTLERQVAIKLLLRDASSAGLIEEARTLAAINHPNIVTIHEIAEHEGRDFIVMEYVPGKTLRQLLEGKQTLRVTLLVICARVAAAIGAAHRAGILHRDVKPENIFVSDEGEVKVLDFGIARRTAPKRPRTLVGNAFGQDVADTLSEHAPQGSTQVTDLTQTAFGTPAYMAPELLHGEPSTERSDVYSLGVVVYECITGKRPHVAESLAELITNVTEVTPAKVADPLGDLVADMLAKDPGRRPSLVEVETQLERIPTLISTTTPKPAKRRTGMIVGGIAGLALAAVVASRLGGSPRSADREDRLELALGDVRVPTHLFGRRTPQAAALTDLLSRSFAWVAGVRFDVIKIEQGEPQPTSAYRLDVALGERRPDLLVATVMLRDVRSGWPVLVTSVEQPRGRYGTLFDAITKSVAQAIDDRTSFQRQPDRSGAQELYERGRAAIRDAQFTEAQAYLDEATWLDGNNFDAWFALTFVRSWANDTDGAVAAATRAKQLAHDLGSHRRLEEQLLGGVIAFETGDIGTARTILEPLSVTAQSQVDADPSDRNRRLLRDTLFYLADTYWHDGRYRDGYQQFERVVATDPSFRPPAIHMQQYAIAHHDLIHADQILGLSSPDRPALAFSQGRYGELAARPQQDIYSVFALEVLRRPVPPALPDSIWGRSSLDRDLYGLAVALRDDPARAKQLFAAAWTTYFEDPVPGDRIWALGVFGETVLAAGMTDEVRLLASRLRKLATGHFRHDADRIGILAAGLLGDRSLIPHDGLTTRNGLLAAAIEAELAGDRASAARQLWSLVRDPGPYNDYPERAALLRILRALGRTKEAAALCADSLRPFSFRAALLPLQRVCEQRR